MAIKLRIGGKFRQDRDKGGVKEHNGCVALRHRLIGGVREGSDVTAGL